MPGRNVIHGSDAVESGEREVDQSLLKHIQTNSLKIHTPQINEHIYMINHNEAFWLGWALVQRLRIGQVDAFPAALVI